MSLTLHRGASRLRERIEEVLGANRKYLGQLHDVFQGYFAVSLKTDVSIEAKCRRDEGGQPQVPRDYTTLAIPR